MRLYLIIHLDNVCIFPFICSHTAGLKNSFIYTYLGVPSGVFPFISLNYYYQYRVKRDISILQRKKNLSSKFKCFHQGAETCVCLYQKSVCKVYRTEGVYCRYKQYMYESRYLQESTFVYC